MMDKDMTDHLRYASEKLIQSEYRKRLKEGQEKKETIVYKEVSKKSILKQFEQDYDNMRKALPIKCNSLFFLIFVLYIEKYQ